MPIKILLMLLKCLMSFAETSSMIFPTTVGFLNSRLNTCNHHTGMWHSTDNYIYIGVCMFIFWCQGSRGLLGEFLLCECNVSQCSRLWYYCSVRVLYSCVLGLHRAFQCCFLVSFFLFFSEILCPLSSQPPNLFISWTLTGQVWILTLPPLPSTSTPAFSCS